MTTLLTRNQPKVLFVVLVSLLCQSCAKTMQAHKMPENQPQASQIYIFRPSLGAYAVRFLIYENDNIAGQIGPKGYLAWNAQPGEIVLKGEVSPSRVSDFVKVEAKPGKTYYFKLEPKIGVNNRFSFVEISEQDAIKYLDKLKQPRIKVVS